MTDSSRPFLVALALTDRSPHPDLTHWTIAAVAAEDAGIDIVTIDAGDADAVLVAAALAARTRHVGIVPVAPTTTTEPFHVSTAIATVDFVATGRAGWLATVKPQRVAQGRVTWTVPANVHADAAEHVAAVRALWDSWEDGAEIRDVQTARFLDRERVHHIDFRREQIAVRGPSITPRPPQGHPPVFVRADDAAGIALARQTGDVAVVSRDTPTASCAGLPTLRELAAGPSLDARVAEARDAGFAGVLVSTTHAELAPTLTALAPELEGRSAAERPSETLRDRLGLAPASNRFAGAVA